jgi:isoaspartyl peptidase/L-asparaginase-like protein (Ntn-hydrolase superfamily)
VLYLKMGLSLDAALREAMGDLHAVEDPYTGAMNIVALDRDGTPAAASNRPGATYIVMRDDMDHWEERERLYVP